MWPPWTLSVPLKLHSYVHVCEGTLQSMLTSQVQTAVLLLACDGTNAYFLHDAANVPQPFHPSQFFTSNAAEISVRDSILVTSHRVRRRSPNIPRVVSEPSRRQLLPGLEVILWRLRVVGGAILIQVGSFPDSK